MSPTPSASNPEVGQPAGPIEGSSGHVPALLTGNKSLTSKQKSKTNITEKTAKDNEASGKLRRPGRPSRSEEAPVTWSIRGVSRETRSAMEQAAARAGKTLGEYFNENLRSLAERELAQKALAPSDAVNLQEEIHYLRRLVENLTSMIAGDSAAEPSAVRFGPKS